MASLQLLQPVEGASAKSEAAQPVAAAAQAPVRVLVVDDEMALTQSIEYALAQRCEVVVANSGLQAQEILARDPQFAVIFCDLMMPDMNGMALHAFLSKEKPELASRMVFMSGGAFTGEATEFLKKIPKERLLDKPFALKTIRDVFAQRVEAGKKGAA